MSETPPPYRSGPEPESPSDSPAARPAGARGARSENGKRPRYLVVALIGALIFGAGCWTEGCNRLVAYRGEYDASASFKSIKDDGDRAHAEALFQRFIDVSDAERGRGIPLAAATFVLGAALLALGARGLAGRSNPRSVLMQVVAAQAVVVAASYFVLKPVRTAELDWQFETWLVQQKETLPAEQFDAIVPKAQEMRRWIPPGWLVFRTVASTLILFALSRPRSRAFFDAASPPVADPADP